MRCWRWFYVIVLPGCALVMLGCQKGDRVLTDDSKNPHVAYGLEKGRAMEYDAAVAAFERAIEFNPRSIRAHYELGLLHDQQRHDYVSALYHYQQVLKLQSRDWPADNVRVRIPVCRRELVKAEALAPITQQIQQELEVLQAENRRLREELEAAKSAQAATMAAAKPGPTRGQERSATTSSNRASVPSSAPVPMTGSDTGSVARAARYHRVAAGETLASISRTYRVDLNALLHANPQIRPRSMAPGQIVRIPEP